MQYFAHPGWDFERLRTEFPDGRYEAGTNIGPDDWMHLTLDVDDASVCVTVDGIVVFRIDETLVSAGPGRVGLFVDIGTEARFANLVVTQI